MVLATQTNAFIAHVGIVLHNFVHSNDMVRNTPKHEFWVYWSGLDAFVVKNSKVVSATQTGAFIAHVGPVLHNFLHSNEMVRNTPKHEFWVSWSGLDAFIAKNSNVISATQPSALRAHVGPVLHNFVHNNDMVRNTTKHQFRV